MTPKLAFVILPFGLLYGESAIKPPPEKTTTEHVDFAAGGLIRINGSYGDLNVAGWDRPEIEVTVIKLLPYGYKPKQPEQAAAHGCFLPYQRLRICSGQYLHRRRLGSKYPTMGVRATCLDRRARKRLRLHRRWSFTEHTSLP